MGSHTIKSRRHDVPESRLAGRFRDRTLIPDGLVRNEKQRPRNAWRDPFRACRRLARRPGGLPSERPHREPATDPRPDRCRRGIRSGPGRARIPKNRRPWQRDGARNALTAPGMISPHYAETNSGTGSGRRGHHRAPSSGAIIGTIVLRQIPTVRDVAGITLVVLGVAIDRESNGRT